ncbi:MAG TPA: helix-turn-helix transcriptional regulator [Fimbriimonadaceae bacterium]|nr:helix-turn-helix transcriptional regulator [Fimbriimonadaceae bacterium]
MQPNAIELRAALAASTVVERAIPGVRMLLYSGPGARIDMHEHERPFITFLVHGMSDETDVYGNVQRIGSGTINFSPAGTRHAHHFFTDRCATLCADFSPGIMALANEHRSELERPRMIRSGPAVEVAHRITLELLEADSYSDLVLQGLYIEMLGEIIRSPGDAMKGAPGWLNVACSMLREAPLSSLSVRDVAAEVAVHPSHLAKAFRRYVGQSPGEFARLARLERACRELHHTSKPLKLIALESGFADQAHFTRAFKRAFGYVPSAARQNNIDLRHGA